MTVGGVVHGGIVIVLFSVYIVIMLTFLQSAHTVLESVGVVPDLVTIEKMDGIQSEQNLTVLVQFTNGLAVAGNIYTLIHHLHHNMSLNQMLLLSSTCIILYRFTQACTYSFVHPYKFSNYNIIIIPAGEDYVDPGDLFITLMPDQSSVTVPFEIISDAIDEPAEEFSLGLSLPPDPAANLELGDIRQTFITIEGACTSSCPSFTQ